MRTRKKVELVMASNRSRKFSYAFLVMLLASLAAPATAVAAGSAADSDGAQVLVDGEDVRIIQDGDWTRWEFREKLKGAETRVFRGTRVATGCNYEIVDTKEVAPTGFMVLEREVAHNLKTCTSITERALVEETQESEGESQVFDTVAETLSPAASGTKSVWLKVAYDDPAFIDVTSVKSSLTFDYNGACVTGSRNHVSTWYKVSWWSYDYKSGQAAQNCSYAAQKSWARMRNDSFCPGSGNTTFTTYTEVTVYGQENGSQTNAYNTSKSGGCSALLGREVLSS